MIPSLTHLCHRCHGDTETVHLPVARGGLLRTVVECPRCETAQAVYWPASDPDGAAAYRLRSQKRHAAAVMRQIIARPTTAEGPALAARLLAALEARDR